jgi:hypothetical protein
MLRDTAPWKNNQYITNCFRSITASARRKMNPDHKDQTCSLHCAIFSPKLHMTPSLSDSQAWTQL